MISRGELWWADMGRPIGSEPAYYRPVLVVQANALNRSRFGSVICVPLTSSLKWAAASGNTLLMAADTGLPQDSVAVAAQITTLDRSQLLERIGPVADEHIDRVLDGLDLVLGR